jgi:serine/threonine-protein kinase ATR
MCDQAFLVWSGLLAVLDSDDLGLIVCQTFALVAQNWDCFSDETQIKASHILGHLVAKNNMLVQDRIAYIPSLTSIPMLSKLGSELARFKGGLDKLVLFNAFSERCNDENIVVVRQALKELVPFLEANQQLLHEAALSEKPFPALPALSRSLLDASVRFAEALSDIPVLCAQCLGLIGALDPYKVETVREKKHILVLSNFEREIEVIDFTASLLERILVKVFHSTTNARAQGYLAYVMQELLKFGGFTAANAHQRPRSSQPSASLQRWSEMPEADRSTLLPFLNSKYMIQTHVAPKKDDTQYPIFKLDTNHSNWLRTFVFDLMKKGRGDNVENIEKLFGTVARVIRTHDLSIATFLLPYAALNVIITGTEQESMNVGQELLIVLKTEILALDEPDAAKVKQCSEVSYRETCDGSTLTSHRTSSKSSIISRYGCKRKEK